MILLRTSFLVTALAAACPVAAQTVGAGPDQPVSLQGGVPPTYPDEAYVVCAHGTTKVLVSIDNLGRNRKSRLHESSGNEALDAAALKAVRSWKFRPAIVAGVPTEGEAIVPVSWLDPCPEELPMSDPKASAIPPAGWDPKVSPHGWDAYEVVAGRAANPPKYPKSACAGAAAKVRVTVAANGFVRSAAIAETSGNAGVDAAAVEAAKAWTYRPGRRGEMVVGGDVIVAVPQPATCSK